MANFDTNQWYQLTTERSTTNAMLGTSLFNNAVSGSVYFATANITSTAQHWQIFPFNSTYYILRTIDSGANGFLGTMYSDAETTPGKTRPRVVNSSIADESVLWQVGAWGDGTFWLANAKNTTDWHFNVKSSAIVAMDSNITGSQPGQRFSFKELGAIEDETFSSVNTPSAFATAISRSTSAQLATKSSNSSSTFSPSSNFHGLSSGASIAIGVSFGIAALLALILGVLFLLRRRKRNPYQSPSEMDAPDYRQEIATGATKYEMSHENEVAKYEMPHSPVRYEMSAAPPIELPGGMEPHGRETQK